MQLADFVANKDDLDNARDLLEAIEFIPYRGALAAGRDRKQRSAQW
jgi:hypothetical protein